MTDYERFLLYGRVRNLVKDTDVYSCTFEKDNKIYVALSSGQVICADKFAHMSDKAVTSWLKLLLMIRGIQPSPRTT